MIAHAREGAVLTVTIDAPATRNALSADMLDALAATWRTASQDDEIHAVLLTGAGPHAFCSGADLKDFADPATRDRVGHAHDAFFPERVLSKPIVAAVNGACIAGGCELLLASDIRYAAAHATFAIPEASLGFFPAGGSAVRAPRRLGWAFAMELLLTAERIDATTAARIGLVNEVVDARDLMTRARATAQTIAALPTEAVQAIKRAAIDADGTPLLDALASQEQVARALHTRTRGRGTP